jgi:hypothetical protein
MKFLLYLPMLVGVAIAGYGLYSLYNGGGGVPTVYLILIGVVIAVAGMVVKTIADRPPRS